MSTFSNVSEFPRSLLLCVLNQPVYSATCKHVPGQKDDLKAAFKTGHIAGSFITRGGVETWGLQKTPAFPCHNPSSSHDKA